MKKPFKIYYNDSMIQTITTEDLQGDYVVVTDEMAKQISNAISSYQVIDKKIVNIKKQHKSVLHYSLQINLMWVGCNIVGRLKKTTCSTVKLRTWSLLKNLTMKNIPG